MTRHIALLFIGASFVLFLGCSSKPSHEEQAESYTTITPSSAVQLVFLTCDGCVNTPILLENLKSAAQSFNPHIEIETVNQATLNSFDARTGYATPTILYQDQDLFGLPEPARPYPAPT